MAGCFYAQLDNNIHICNYRIMFICSNRLFSRMLTIAAAALLLCSGIASIQTTPHAYAAPVSDWQAGYIISDENFYTQGNMSTAQIQDFLNEKGKYCYGDRCLKNYRGTLGTFSAGSCPRTVQGGNGLSAAEMIYRVSKSCNISAKALLVTLEKENSLVTSPAWYNSRTGRSAFHTALGFGCPDTAPCDSQYYGVGNQIYHAAKQFNIYKKYPYSFNHQAGKTAWIGYNPSSSCGGSNVYIRNAATAGLYNYTPYQPNAAALQAGVGTGDWCSAYGNRNFYVLYKNWFGDPRTSTPARIVTKEKIAALKPLYSSSKLAPWGWNDTMKKLQEAMLLAVPTFPEFTPDGGYGTRTIAIVKNFQEENDLPVTGEVDQDTAYALIRKGFPVYVATPHTYYSSMAKGAYGDAVLTLQIGAKGLYPQWFSATPDASYGAKTASFVSQFQASHNLPSTGIVDAATAQALQKSGIPLSIKEIPEPEPIYLDHVLWNYEWSLDVLQVQRALVKYFPQYAQFEPDGGFGPKTEEAVKAIQRANGIYPDGGVGQKTLQLLRSVGVEADMISHASSQTLLTKGVWYSPSVLTLQQGLRKHFPQNFPHQPDGCFGNGTEEGVKAAQRYFGIRATGIVDADTAEKFQQLGIPLSVANPPQELAHPLNTPLGQWQWNSNVLALQKILKYYFPVQTPYTPDGGYGVGTKAGMIEVQNIIGAPATGVFDEATAAALQAYGIPLLYR